jgi:hypothetical protein
MKLDPNGWLRDVAIIFVVAAFVALVLALFP